MSGFLVLSAYKVLENDCDKSLIHRHVYYSFYISARTVIAKKPLIFAKNERSGKNGYFFVKRK